MEFDGLTDKQTQNLFTLSQICGIQLSVARTLLQRADFNVEQATQLHFNPAPIEPVYQPQQPVYHPQPNYPQQHQYMQQEQPYYDDQDEDPNYTKFRNYKFSGNTFEAKYPMPSSGIKSMFSWISNKFKGEITPGDRFRQKLQQLFPKVNKVNFLKGTFLDAMYYVKKQKFPLIVLTHNFALQHRQLLRSLISNSSMAEFLNTTFRVIGLDLPDYQADQFLTNSIDRKNIPCMSIFKIDECQEIVLMDIIELVPSTDFKELKKRINASKSKYIKDEIKEAEYAKRFANELNGNYVSNPMTFEKKLQLQDERRIKQLQQKQLRQQNKQLAQKRILQQKQQQLQKQKQKQGVRKIQQRKTRRQTLQIFTSGVRFRLRLPNGNQLMIIVPQNQKIEYLFEFVDCQEDLGFEDDVGRKFDIIRPYDRLVLGEVRGKSVKEVFGETDSESLVVNELG